MKKIAFTICAKNYIGLAQTLGNSISRYNKDILFLIFIADEMIPGDDLLNKWDNIIVAKDVVDIPQNEWYQMCFKYDITEFCTSIKPSCFKYIFEKYETGSCIYFDPDILIFDTLDDIYKKLEKYSIILTPHITSMEEVYTGRLSEQNILYSGMFNLGFLALKCDQHSIRMLNWWKVRLKDRCYQNKMENYFTDQKWMDFLPSFFPSQLLVSSDLGLNVAPWNFYEREIVVEKDILFVKNRIEKNDGRLYRLTFVHFSGFNYSDLLKNEVSQGNIDNLEIPDDIHVVFEKYGEYLLKSDVLKFIGLPYTYNFFSNRVYISLVYRRLYRRMLEDEKIDDDPFNSNGHFFIALKKAGLINKNMLASDKTSISNVSDLEKKVLIVNKILLLLFKIVGAKRFFILTRLMRLYSKHENHVYLIDKGYRKNFMIRN